MEREVLVREKAKDSSTIVVSGGSASVQIIFTPPLYLKNGRDYGLAAPWTKDTRSTKLFNLPPSNCRRYFNSVSVANGSTRKAAGSTWRGIDVFTFVNANSMYVQYKVNAFENQVDTSKDAIRLKKGVTLCFPKGGTSGDHVQLLTPAQINRLDRAQA